MSSWFDTPIGTGRLVLLGIALLVACGFEIVNGFHDTANAVATVIYTRSLRPTVAVVWSGVFNLFGVLLGGIAVAMGILKLLPVELLVESGSAAGLAMVLALLVGAILWNLGTWRFGLPVSSTHTLIGAIVGVGFVNSLLPGHVSGSGVNWPKVAEAGLSLLISPLLGFVFAAALVWLSRIAIERRALHEPAGAGRPPRWIRALLITTCTGVSYAHGSNDGQKGVGLVMLVLIGLLPADFALNGALQQADLAHTTAVAAALSRATPETFGAGAGLAAGTDMAAAREVLGDLARIRGALAGKRSVGEIAPGDRLELRRAILRADGALDKLITGTPDLPPAAVAELNRQRAELRKATDYAPRWVLLLIASSLGIGTLVGWKRIAITVGEKIGKSHLTYAQGASAELVAMTTIVLSSWLGLPVSTTHVLSSGIAGTMAAQRAGLQRSTVRNILLAWVLTLPASMLIAAALFLGFRAIIPGASAARSP